MASLAEFVDRLLTEGRVVFTERPEVGSSVSVSDRDRARAILARAFAEEMLDLAGPPLAFAPEVALAAAELTRQASWLLVDRSEPVSAMAGRLTMPPAPRTPSEHLSADVTLRYLPTVHRRARALAPDDALTNRLAEVLRRWPLSGVLSDLADGPLTPLDFGGHHGLVLLYAERLAGHEKPAWTPAEGRPRQYVEWVYQELGRTPPTRPGRDDLGTEAATQPETEEEEEGAVRG